VKFSFGTTRKLARSMHGEIFPSPSIWVSPEDKVNHSFSMSRPELDFSTASSDVEQALWLTKTATRRSLHHPLCPFEVQSDRVVLGCMLLHSDRRRSHFALFLRAEFFVGTSSGRAGDYHGGRC